MNNNKNKLWEILNTAIWAAIGIEREIILIIWSETVMGKADLQSKQWAIFNISSAYSGSK